MSERDASKSAEVVKESVAISEDDLRTKVLQFMKSEVAVNLVEADIIVSGGRGVGKPEGFKILQDLANALGAALGASRAAVDSGWIPPGAPGGSDRKDGEAEDLHSVRHLGGHSASRWDENFRLHRGREQGCRCPYLQDSLVWYSWGLQSGRTDTYRGVQKET